MKKIELFNLSTNKSLKKDFIFEIDHLIETNDWIMGDSVIDFENSLKIFYLQNIVFQ